MSALPGFMILVSGASFAGVQGSANLNQKLDAVRNQRLNVEKALIEAEQAKRSTEDQLKRLKTLQKLQTQEKVLTEKRLKKLEGYLGELQERKQAVQKRLDDAKVAFRQKIQKLIHPLFVQNEELIRGEGDLGVRFLRERILSGVAGQDLKDLEGLRVDLQDAEEIESRIEQEKQQISSLMQDVSEQESLIQFHKKIREDLTLERHEEHLKQLEEYQKLKTSESEIERMISDFEGRQKREAEKDEQKKLPVVTLKPKSLPWPLQGKLVGTYGQRKDPGTGLNIFSKGIEILTIKDHAEVQSVMEGRVQYSGEIPGKGKVLILEHSHSIYSIYGGLRELVRTRGDQVKASENLGFLESDKPLYFEIRSGNIAIDPVKWLQ
jgi:septal ring factor EnvC (AmiA/AmiB activator)